MTFDFWVFGKVDKVIHVDSKGERGRWNACRGVGGVDDAAREQAWVQCIGLETQAIENCRDIVVPVAWAPAQAVQRLRKKPILVFLGIRIADGGFHYRDLVVGEYALEKCIFTIPLLEGTSTLYR